jgi:peptidoglycan hydrolase-like protein with peptidoglycan-binding domain
MDTAMDRKITGVVIGLLAALLAVWPGQGAAKNAHVGTAAAAKAASGKSTSAKGGATGTTHDKTDQATAVANAAMPEAERLGIQADLAMVGDYQGPAGGDFDARTIAAIKAFQKRNGGKETGLLSEQDRALLAAAAQRHGQASGWRVIEDVSTGAQFGLPAALVPQSAATRTGSRWTSAHGQITVETFRLQDAALAALFDAERTARQRHAEWSALKPDAFVLSGEQGLKRFTVRAQSRGSELRGITILYDQATAGTMDRLATAIADSFDGFPDPARATPGLRRSVEYGTAIAVTSRGDFIAPAKLTAQCQAIVIAGLGHAERIAEDGASDLALLRVNGAQGGVPAAIAGTAAAADDVSLVGIADPRVQSGEANGSNPTRLSARLTGQAIDPAPMLGFAGAAAVDPQGRLAGMVDLQPGGGAGAGRQATLVPAASIREFLVAHGIDAADGEGVAEQSIRRVICVRK